MIMPKLKIVWTQHIPIFKNIWIPQCINQNNLRKNIQKTRHNTQRTIYKKIYINKYLTINHKLKHLVRKVK
jgi:hypothetical protein